MMTMRLSDLIFNSPIKKVEGNAELMVSGIAFDSREVGEGNVFVAVSGRSSDGHRFISQAITKGAVAVVCEQLPDDLKNDVCYVVTENSAFTLARMSSSFFGHPSSKLRLIGVTGTNGKTTVATLLYQLFMRAGYPSGLLSTVENRINNSVVQATHTTPDALSLNRLLARMVDEGCSYAFMEVSSHALDQFRVTGLNFAGAIFTNLTHDHLDYHGTFAQYRDAKKLFFDMLGSGAFALVNNDDRNASFMVQNTKAAIYTYGLTTEADFRAKILENSFGGLILRINEAEVHSPMVGSFNASNLIGVFAAAVLGGMAKHEAITGISSLTGAEGRFELIRSSSGITGIVDYAHTPDALENVLETINAIRSHNETLITVAGAGGDRDRSKRPEMARVAAMLSNKLILTSDNPRSEKPEEIIAEMRKGVEPQHYSRLLAITDRREAIRTAVALAKPGDIILVAGKGHEKYQEIMGVKHPFDDKVELTESLNNR